MKRNRSCISCFLAIVLLMSLFTFGFQTASAETSDIMYGDINGDGKINSTDLSALKRYILELAPLPGDSKTADLNGDGLTNSSDLSLLKRYILGLITVFPVSGNNQPALAKWVGTWATSQQLVESSNMPPSPGLSGNTLRQVVRVSIGGNKLRLNFSNEYGTSPVTMNSVHLAESAGSGSIKSGTDKVLSFGGKEAVTIPAGKTVTSDTFDYNLTKMTNMAVTIYFGSTSTALTGHPGSRTTSYILSGNKVDSLSMTSAATTAHWYIVSGIDVFVDDSYKAVVALGDSITDGRGSTTDGNDRWTDDLALRLLGNTATSKVAMLNHGIGGNAVLTGGLGPTTITRFDRDVLGQSGVRYLMILDGVNDIGSSSNTQVATDLINAFKTFISKAHQKDILVYGITILPFGGSQYDSTIHEQARQTVNNWIRTSGSFDAVIDLEAAVQDPSNKTKLLSAYDSGDHLHPNSEGYKKIASMIDLALFTK